MSEHVLCMVLYLIELGLDNQVEEDKEDEVRPSATQRRRPLVSSYVLFTLTPFLMFCD